MAKVYTFPHYVVNVVDHSTYIPFNRETLPLFVPIFFMRAQQGPLNVPQWCATRTDAATIFGDATFDYTSKYFSREALYLNQLLTRQGSFIVRLASSDALAGSLVLQLQVRKTKVTQYERDAYGQFVIDETTQEKIPLTDEDGGEVVTEDGYELKWTTRAMTADEELNTLKPVTHGSGETAYTVYPILAVRASSVGAFANDTGFKFFCDLDNIDDTMAYNVGAIPYSFGAVKKNYGEDTATAILSSLNNQFETFVAKPDSVDERVERNVSFEQIIASEYPDNTLPYTTYLYSDYIKEIGELIMAVEQEDDDTLTDPYLVNLCEPYNVEGIPYGHVVMSTDDDAIDLDENRILYLEGGADGTITDAMIEELTRHYLRDGIYEEILDQARYPFTHIIDTGVTVDTKYAFIDFLGKHDAFKVILSTQDATEVMGRYNTKAEDLSMGSALYARCLLQPESTVKGTECCRAEIYQQAGKLADSNYKGIVPATYDIMIKKSRYLYSTSITGQPAGLPNSAIEVFKEWNWTPCDKDHKQRAWDSGLNYFQYYDMTGIHWPAMRTVYRYDTSVLSNAMFTDVVVFTKHIARYNWARFAGMEMEFSMLATRATSAVTNDMAAMLNGLYNFSVAFTQSEEEARIGYKSHCTIQIWGNPQQRQWEIDIECYRNGFDPTASSTTAEV